MTSGLRLRPARPDEARALSALAVRSKASWGYDDDFLARVRGALQIHPEMCVDRQVVVAEEAGEPLGFRRLEFRRTTARLADLFVAPEHFGRGVGRALWEDAVGAARDAGVTTLRLESDPHAEGFYRRLGAVRVGEVETLPGRFLPVLELDLVAPGPS